MLHLINDQLGVQPIFPPDTSASGRIIIPDQAKDRCTQGIVKYVGPDVKDIQIGDYVLFGAYTGTLMYFDGEYIIIFKEPFCEAIAHPDANIEIPGMFFKTTDGEFLPLNYEMTFQLLADGIQNSEWQRNFKIKPRRRDKDEYKDH